MEKNIFRSRILWRYVKPLKRNKTHIDEDMAIQSTATKTLSFSIGIFFCPRDAYAIPPDSCAEVSAETLTSRGSNEKKRYTTQRSVSKMNGTSSNRLWVTPKRVTFSISRIVESFDWSFSHVCGLFADRGDKQNINLGDFEWIAQCARDKKRKSSLKRPKALETTQLASECRLERELKFMRSGNDKNLTWFWTVIVSRCLCSSTMFVSSNMAAIFFESATRTLLQRSGELTKPSNRPSTKSFCFESLVSTDTAWNCDALTEFDADTNRIVSGELSFRPVAIDRWRVLDVSKQLLKIR